VRISTLLRGLCLCAFAGAAPACVFGRPPERAVAGNGDFREQIRQLNRAMEAAFNRRDLLAVAAFYSDSGCLIAGRSGLRTCGRVNIDAYWSGIPHPLAWTLEAFDVDGGDTGAYQIGRSTLITGTGATRDTSITDFVVIWKKNSSGTWKILLDLY
jgi:ketosteroid isomerase-like protein